MRVIKRAYSTGETIWVVQKEVKRSKSIHKVTLNYQDIKIFISLYDATAFIRELEENEDCQEEEQD